LSLELLDSTSNHATPSSPDTSDRSTGWAHLLARPHRRRLHLPPRQRHSCPRLRRMEEGPERQGSRAGPRREPSPAGNSKARWVSQPDRTHQRCCTDWPAPWQAQKPRAWRRRRPQICVVSPR